MGSQQEYGQPNAEFAEEAQSSQSFSENELSQLVIGCAIEVQRHLGTGLLESAYAAALAFELGGGACAMNVKLH